jgi:hypothetical protein
MMGLYEQGDETLGSFIKGQMSTAFPWKALTVYICNCERNKKILKKTPSFFTDISRNKLEPRSTLHGKNSCIMYRSTGHTPKQTTVYS